MNLKIFPGVLYPRTSQSRAFSSNAIFFLATILLKRNNTATEGEFIHQSDELWLGHTRRQVRENCRKDMSPGQIKIAGYTNQNYSHYDIENLQTGNLQIT